MPNFLALFLLQTQQIQEKVVKYYLLDLGEKLQLKKDKKWSYLVIHRISLDPFKRKEGLKFLKEEIQIFNLDLKDLLAKEPVQLFRKEELDSKAKDLALLYLKEKIPPKFLLIIGKYYKLEEYKPK